jgi:hypothetical protein
MAFLLLLVPALYGNFYITGKIPYGRGIMAHLGLTGILFLLGTTHLRHHKIRGSIIALIISALYFLHTLYFGVSEFSGRGFDEGFFLSLQAEAVDMAWNNYFHYFLYFGVGAIAVWASLLASSPPEQPLTRTLRLCILLLSALFLAKGYKTLPAWQFANAVHDWIRPAPTDIPSSALEYWSKSRLLNLYLPARNELQTEIPKNPKNLILLYVESGGVMLAPSEKYPGINENFMKLIRDHGFVPHIHASSFITIEGLVNTQCGTLLPFNGGDNKMTFGNLVYNMPCLGDVLHNAGYTQIFHEGTSRNFSGTGTFLGIHGYDEIVGKEDWGRKGVPPKKGDYGIGDPELFDQSLKKIRELEASTQPYNLTLFTIGTHVPGFSYPECEKYAEDGDQYLNAVHCTDQLVGKWVESLKDEGVFKNTILVITGDHQVFSNTQMKALFGNRVHDTRLPLIIIGDNLPKPLQMDGAGYDIAPTIIDLLGIKTNAKFALGRSLVREQRTLQYFLSRYGDVLNEKTHTHPDTRCGTSIASKAGGSESERPLTTCERAQLDEVLRYQAELYSR